MRSSLPKVLHPICGRPMILWPLLAARAAGAERVVVVDNPKRLLADAPAATTSRSRSRSEPRGTGDAVAAAADRIDPGAPVVVINGDMPLITGEAIAAVVAAHSEARAAATLATMELDDPSGYGRVVRAADGSVERVVETKAAGDATARGARDPRGQRRPLRVRRRRAAEGARASSTRTTRRASCTCPTSCPRCSPPACAVRSVHAGRPRAGARGQRPRRPRARDPPRPAAHPRRPPARRRHDRGPREHLIEAAWRSGRTRRSSPRASCAAGRAIGARCTIGPLSTVIDSVLGDGVAVRHSYLDGATAAAGVTIGPFAYLRPGAVLQEHAKAGTFVEIKNSDDRRRARRSRTCPTSATPTSARDPTSARARSPPTTTAAASTARRSGTASACPSTRRSSRPSPSATTPIPRPARVITEDVPPGALGIARAAPDEHRGLRRAAARARRETANWATRVDAVGRWDYTGRASECAGTSARGRQLDQPRVRQAPHAVLGAREPRAGGQDRRAS